jgi:hypothetical protein
MSETNKIQCYYFGESCPLEMRLDPNSKKTQITFSEGVFYLTSPKSGPVSVEPLLQSFYTRELKKYLDVHISRYQPHFKIKPRGVTVEDSKLRWGSCNSNRQLTFNWRLAMLPPEVIDYVIVHELCHLVHLNHDRSFWRLVGKIVPNYKNAMAYLGNTKRTE